MSTRRVSARAHTPYQVSEALLREDLYGYSEESPWTSIVCEIIADCMKFDRGIVHYSMTKSAAQAFHEGLAAELRNHERGLGVPEIKLTCVHPTWAATPMTEAFRDKLPALLEPQTVADAVVKQVLSGRGKQIILGGGVGWIAGIRAWPSWLSGGLTILGGR